MATLELETRDVGARLVKTLTYHKDRPAGAQVKLELGEDELASVVPAGKSWNIQVSLYITETDT